MMKRLLAILCVLLPLAACVGQKDDPEPDPDPVVTPDDPEPEPEPDPGPEGSGAFLRHSLVLDFTGTWCVNCPGMQAAIAEASTQRPGLIIPVAVHYMDKMAVKPLGTDLAARFGVSAYPSAVVDLDASTLMTIASAELILSYCDKLLESRYPAAGVQIESTLDDGQVSATVEAYLMRDGDYSLHLLLLEDGIVASQTGAGADYVHNDVLRAWLDGQEQFDGKGKGDVISASFSLEAAEGMRLVAMVCRDGIVENVISCTAGGHIYYEYE